MTPRFLPAICLALLPPMCGPVAQSMEAQTTTTTAAKTPWALAIHGGAGSGEWEHMTPATENAYHHALERALQTGTDVLSGGGRSLDAVEAVLRVLEDDPLFNAGRGSAFSEQGRNEMDAALMNGADLTAGSVAGVHATKHPISLARAVMERTKYVMMVGEGADTFSIKAGLEQRPPAYFFTASRWQELTEILKASGRPLPPLPPGVSAAELHGPSAELTGVSVHHQYGTTGVVARDRHGDIAAGTSTGGMQGKMPGRVGDSPIIGAGTYADNGSCAVSGTGVGEYFIRLNLARRVCDLVQFRGMALQAAADQVIHTELPSLKGGEGGVIVLDTKGPPVWSFNTLGMFRARAVEGGAAEIDVRH